MSRAFTKEDDGESEDLPERPASEGPNYVTPRGFALLEEAVDRLARERARLLPQRNDPAGGRKLKETERDLRYYRGRLETAVTVDNARRPPADVRFGAAVELDQGGKPRRVALVGEDEADPEKGLLSWNAPLAQALLGAKVGDKVSWGEAVLEVKSLSYS